MAGCSTSAPPPQETAPTVSSAPEAVEHDVFVQMTELESEYEARIGISALDTRTGSTVAFRAEERFGYASSIKAFVAAQFLREVPAADRDELITWSADALDAAGYSPVTSEHVETGLTLAQLAEAAVRESDNLATNLVLERIGGPSGLRSALRDLGDDTTAVVNFEPALNTIEPGSIDDTSTPDAFTDTLSTFLNDDTLSAADRATWIDWMSGNATGDALVRAGAPAGWTVADKSGGAGGIRNDVAVVTPQGEDPVLITIFTSKNDASAPYDDAVVERAAAIVFAAFGSTA